MLESGADLLSEACCRPRWRIFKHDLKDWYFSVHLSDAPSVGYISQLRCTEAGPGEQSRLTGLMHYLLQGKPRPFVNHPPALHRWQLDPLLPKPVIKDLSNHRPRSMLSPEGWDIVQCNGRTLFTGPNLQPTCIDSAQAQYIMLCALQHD